MSYTELMTCTAGQEVTRSQPGVEKHVIEQEESRSSEAAQGPQVLEMLANHGATTAQGLCCAQSPLLSSLTAAGSPGRPGSPCGDRIEVGMGQRPP